MTARSRWSGPADRSHTSRDQARYSSGTLNFVAHSPEDKQRDGRYLRVRLWLRGGIFVTSIPAAGHFAERRQQVVE
jgi:hypothetical protein